MLLIQNILRPFDGRYPGKVEETRNLERKNLDREERRVWRIKYYRETLGEERAKKKIYCTKEELIKILVIKDEADPGEEDMGNGNGYGDTTIDAEYEISEI